MKNWKFGITLAIVLIFAACGDDNNTVTDNTPPPALGSVTLLNIPQSYVFDSLMVFSYSSVEWVQLSANSLTSKPGGQPYFQNGLYPKSFDYLIGSAAPEYASPGDPPNKITIHYNKDNIVFNGYGSIWVTLQTDIFKYHTYNEEEYEIFLCIGINNVNFSNGNATIDIAQYLFQLPETDGELTLTNASEFNNKYAIVFGTCGSNPAQPNAIYGFNDATSVSDFKGLKIENGEVAIPLYQITFGDNKFTAFDYTGEAAQIVIIILETEVFDYVDFATVFANPAQTKYKCLLYMPLSYSNGITFSNGVGTADPSNAEKVPTGTWTW